MKIVLDEKYSVSTDEYNYILHSKRVKGNKQDNLGYFPNLDTLIHYLLNHAILVSKAESFMEIKQLVDVIAPD